MQMISEELVNCSTAYYNENDPFAAAWLRELITAGHIAHGIVDERSIEDVTPNDLAGFTQCHFFAGIGGWSHALRLAGWPDDRPVWTGSCPCQPFSAAGKGGGFDDERHLWPAFHWLIQQCGPSVVFGEQVASKATSPWFDLVQADLEAMGYDFGCIPFPAAGVGAPHIRDRAFWLGYTNQPRPQGLAGDGGAAGREGAGGSVTEAGVSSGLADAYSRKREGLPVVRGNERDGADAGREEGFGGVAAPLQTRGLADSEGVGECTNESRRNSGNGIELVGAESGGDGSHDGANVEQEPCPGPTNGFWQDVDWLLCRDGKWRPVEPGTFPLAHGVPSRVGRLRGYGNAIVPQAAAEFIQAFQGEKESSYD